MASAQPNNYRHHAYISKELVYTVLPIDVLAGGFMMATVKRWHLLRISVLPNNLAWRESCNWVAKALGIVYGATVTPFELFCPQFYLSVIRLDRIGLK